VKNEIHSVPIGQSAHWDLVKKPGLQHILFHKSCLRRILFDRKSGLRRIFFIFFFFFLHRHAFDLKFLILSTNSLVVKMIRTPILNDHKDTICTKQ